MTILGCVRSIHSTSIEIALPGRMNGTVNVASISQTHLSIAQRFVDNEQDESSKTETDTEYKPLNELFRIGQVVCVKVIKIDTTKFNRIIIELSMQPKDILMDYQHQHVKKDMILSVAIAERQEYGFVIETGINNLRGFLPDKEVGENRLFVGNVYFCRVKAISTTSTASTATFTLTNDSNARIAKFREPNVNYILPVSVVQFTITKILKDGLQGTIFDGALVAYINEHQLGFSEKNQSREATDFKVGSCLKARVLYTMPLTKIVYLSLNLQEQFGVDADANPNDAKPYQILAAGTVVESAKVSHIGTGGIILKMPKAKGIVSLRSIKADYKSNFDSETILSKFQKDTFHKVRILHYDPIDLLHVCSVDAKIISEKYFTSNDIDVGELINVKIQRKLKDGRYAFALGKVNGFIHPFYMSKITLAKQLKPNQMLRCRVLCKNQQKSEIFVTNHKEYMDENAAILTAKTPLQIDLKCLGLIKKCLSDGWLIEFFDYITGMIYRNQLTISELSTAERFYEGQIIKVVIKHIRKDDDGKRQIALGLADFQTDIGTIHSGKVTAIQPTGIDVAFLTGNVNGFVPIMYLSDFPSLVHTLHSVYQCNDDVKAIGVAQNCYSIRDVVNIFNEPVTIPKFHDLKVGDIIPAFIKNVNDGVIDVHCFVKDVKSTVPIHLKMFVETYEKAGDVTLVPDQKIFVKILSKNVAFKSLTLSAKLSDVWNGDFRQTVCIQRKYFDDLNRIGERLKGDSLKKYRIGEIVEGVHTKSDRVPGANQLRMFLINGTDKVYVTQKNDAFQRKGRDEKFEILIIWIDYANDCMYGTMVKKYLERIKSEQCENEAAQQLLSHPGFKANVLLVLDDVIVAYPTKWTNRFVYIPTRFHYNDFQSVVSKAVKEGDQINLIAISVSGEHFIGMIHNLYELYSKKINQTTEENVKEEIKEENDIEAENTQKSGKKKRKVIETIEIKEENETEDDLSCGKGVKIEKKVKNAKKRKADASSSVTEISDIENVEEKASKLNVPLKKQKLAKTKSEKRTPKITPTKKQHPKKDVKKSVVNPKGKTLQNKKVGKKQKNQSKPSPNPQSKKKFSLASAQLDGALDLVDSDDSSSDEEAKQQQMPGVSNFWSSDLNTLNANEDQESSSESSSDDVAKEPISKKKKLTAKERFEAARNEEARIREIEKNIADDNVLPTSIDQFDRLVMAEPNNSRIWIQYMVFHVQATEIDRARAIARKALSAIDVREEQERLNIWVALLNMELRYGSKDAFEDTLKEALMVNEPFKVYSVCLKIFADCQRTQELNDTVLLMTKKFRQNTECWLNAAQALLQVGLAEKAKSLLNRSLTSLPERDRKTFFLIF